MHLPAPAYSNDRTHLPDRHPTSGSPEEWFAGCSVPFDFFVDWQTRTLGRELWVKVLLDPDDPEPDALPIDALAAAVRACDPAFDKRAGFLSAVGGRLPLEAYYMLYRDPLGALTDPFCVYKVHPAPAGWQCEPLPLPALKEQILQLTGERRGIGEKGLTISTSNLEFELSKTDTLWPGDTDALVLRKADLTPYILLEYRKHTKKTGLTSVSLYCNAKSDRRKYDRLDILARALGVPLVVLTYPTSPLVGEVWLELLETDQSGHHTVAAKAVCPVPAGPGDTSHLRRRLYALVKPAP